MTPKNQGRRPPSKIERDLSDEEDLGSAPDVQVFQLPEEDADEPPREAAPASTRAKKWIEEARTKLWDGRLPADPQELTRPDEGEAAPRAAREPTTGARRAPSGIARVPSGTGRSSAQRTGTGAHSGLARSPSQASGARRTGTQPAAAGARQASASAGMIEARQGGARSGTIESRPGAARSRVTEARQTRGQALVPRPTLDDAAEGSLGDVRQRPPKLISSPIKINVRPVERISPDRRLHVMTRPESAAAEQYRVLALKLRDERGARTIAVAAPTRDALGPVAATNLALALAEGSRSRVALVEGDLRQGPVAGLFELTEGPGLAEQVRGHRREPAPAWIVFGVGPNLSVLPSGPPEKNPASLLNSEAMGDLVQELRRMFDFLVVAGPPVMESADVNILLEHVDGLVLVARAGRTRRESVAASVSRVGESRIFGLALLETKPVR